MGQLLVALDVDSGARALELASQLRDLAGGVKVGSRLFTSEGPTLVRRLVETGANVFLDLKFHDIPNTVAQAVEAAVSTGVWMLNVHASGGVPMMLAAARAAADTASREGRRRPLVIGVTVLTSMDDATLRGIGVQRPLLEQVVTLARMAQDAGLDGVVASPQETAAIRAACGPDFSIVTPFAVSRTRYSPGGAFTPPVYPHVTAFFGYRGPVYVRSQMRRFPPRLFESVGAPFCLDAAVSVEKLLTVLPRESTISILIVESGAER